jgi:hypothetical protein
MLRKAIAAKRDFPIPELQTSFTSDWKVSFVKGMIHE